MFLCAFAGIFATCNTAFGLVSKGDIGPLARTRSPAGRGQTMTSRVTCVVQTTRLCASVWLHRNDPHRKSSASWFGVASTRGLSGITRIIVTKSLQPAPLERRAITASPRAGAVGRCWHNC